MGFTLPQELRPQVEKRFSSRAAITSALPGMIEVQWKLSCSEFLWLWLLVCRCLVRHCHRRLAPASRQLPSPAWQDCD